MTLSSQISLATCTPSTSAVREQHLLVLLRDRKRLEGELRRSVGGSTKESVTLPEIVVTDTPALSVEETPMQLSTAPVVPVLVPNASLDLASERPKFFHNFLWRKEEITVTPSASATETAPPLPGPPPSEFLNQSAIKTIQNNPSLFSIVTPINVSRFESLLFSHPNRPLVESVIRGLREGFWPYADTSIEGFPDSWDESSLQYNISPEAASFLDSQCREEERLGRFSAPFASANDPLLLGMFSMPVHAVSKPNSTKMRMVVDHSAGPFALNTMIPRDPIAVRLDNIQDLGQNLLTVRTAS